MREKKTPAAKLDSEGKKPQIIFYSGCPHLLAAVVAVPKPRDQCHLRINPAGEELLAYWPWLVELQQEY